MNAITMKLENRLPTATSSKEKLRTIAGKKCKNNRKKSNPANTDQDASLTSHGLGRKPGDNVNPDVLKSNVSLEINSSKKCRSKKASPKPDEKMPPRSERMQERLEQLLSSDVREKISSILNDVRALSDVEKLFLYLQLPTGVSLDTDSFKTKNQNPLGKKADEEGMIAVTWIQSHFEEDPEVSLPKQEVYNEYQSYCQTTGTESLCAADFGKVMKQIFPSVKPRRLGTRGNSRYCYSGLRKKLKLKSPLLPDMQADEENSEIKEENIKDETTMAACHVLFEWAEKLLGIKFTSLKDLASHLLDNMYVDNRSVAAFTVLLEGSPQLLEKGFSNCEGGVKKSDAQIHLQRKIQEKELIKEQKKKLQEQRLNLASQSKGKAGASKKKNSKSKKSKLTATEAYDINFCIDKESDSYPTKSSEGSCEGISLEEKTFEIKEEEFELEPNLSQSSSKSPVTCDIAPQQPFLGQKSIKLSPGNSAETEIEDTVKKKSSILVSRSKTPVCIAQSLPGIIIVPHLADMAKQNAAAPKYKRIQPKPQKNKDSVVMRVRAGSVGSSLVSKPKTKANDGRRSSHACLQSVCSPEVEESGIYKRIVALRNPKSNLKKDNFAVPKDVGSGVASESRVFSGSEEVSKLIQSQISSKSISELISKSSLAGNCIDLSLPSEEVSAVKRHLDENDEASASKRLHIDSERNLGMMESILPWAKNETALQNENFTNLNSEVILPNAAVGEVSVHDIEGDALIDYLRGANQNVSILNSLQQTGQKIDSEQLSSNNQVKQLSQLRMLLEQNLPRRIANESTTISIKDGGLSSIPSSILQESVLLSSQPTKSSVINGKKLFSEELSQTILETGPNYLCNSELTSATTESNKIDSDNQLSAFERLLSYNDLTTQVNVNEQQELLTNPSIFLNDSKSDNSQMDISLNNSLSNLDKNIEADNLWNISNVIPGSGYVPNQASNSLNSVRVSTYTQVPSVPQSPNTRRRAFNFMPISPRHTPIPDTNCTNISSPVPNLYPRNMLSKAVGPSQPPSNAGSPFVSPRSTPVSMCRSRHSSGQSTSRHTPFQNFDSGVSSVSSSPFISPQPTPVPVSRLRHNSSHCTKTVTFSSINSPQIIHSNNLGQLRSRHSSGPGGPHLITPRTAPLSPLVTEHTNFVFPSGNNEVRSRHNSGSTTTTTPLSPVSEQSSSSNLPDLPSENHQLSRSFLNAGAGDLLLNGNPATSHQVRQRHASSSVIYNKPYFSPKDNFEIQNLLRNAEPNLFGGSRSQSVPLHQMLQNLDSYCFSQGGEGVSSFPPSVVDLHKMDWSGPISDDLQTTLEDLRDCDTDFSKFAQELELSQNEDVSLQ